MSVARKLLLAGVAAGYFPTWSGRYEYMRRAEGRLATWDDLLEAVHERAVQRLRPVSMTVTAIVAGLLPIMWAHGAGGT